MRCDHERKQHTLACLVVLAATAVLAVAARSAEPNLSPADDLPLPKLPMWYPSVELRGAIGYKDNVTLSSTNAEASAFWQSSLEALVFRLPSHGWQLNFYLSADDVRYFDAPSVDNEQVVMAVAQAVKKFGPNWKSTWGINYLFQNQVFDLSSTYTNEASIGKALGHTLSPRWAVRRQFGPVWAEAELVGTRQLLDEPLDSYWQAGPRAALGYSYGHGSEATLAWQWSQLAYDSRAQVDRSGAELPNTSLAMQVHLVELAWSHTWDEPRRWETTTRLSYEAERDNGSGFYDYDVARITQRVRFRVPTWEVTGQVQAGWYHYPYQTVSLTDAARRQRTLVTGSLRIAKKLSKHWKVHATWHYDRSLSNLEFDDYQANTVMGGIGYEF